jgi:hypothetical protein
LESDEAYQRHRLSTLDGAFAWATSLTSLIFSVANAVLGQKYALAAVPLFIPLFAIPITEGYLMGSVIKESLAWRARGWATFVVGVVAATNYMILQILFLTVRLEPALLMLFGLELAIMFIVVYLCFRFAEFVNRLYGTNFAAIRAKHDIDRDNAQFVYGGILTGAFTGLACAALSLSIAGFPSLPLLLTYALLILGLVMWIAISATSSGRREW